jgi:RHS repeat-associated protein
MYDGFDRMISETTPQGTLTYTYDGTGRRSSLTVVGQPSISYGYDDAGRLTTLTQNGGTVTITYDVNGRRTSLTLPNGVAATYAYDRANHLTGIAFTNGDTTVGDLSYTYDAAGNRTATGGSLAQTILPGAMAAAAVDPANHLTQWNGAPLTYDAAGNLTGDGINTYTWNARNQLVSIGGSVTATFAYDPFGRRARRNVGGVTTRYLYDGVTAVQELDDAGPIANLLTSLDVDETFVRTDANGSVGLLADALGSVIALTDASGAVTTRYAYGPFGQVTASGAASANTTQFTGRENDGTGLYYYRSRYYSPQLGRFVSEDPLGLAGFDVNMYAYVGNTPTMFSDPFGRDKNTNHWSMLDWDQNAWEAFLSDALQPLKDPCAQVFLQTFSETGLIDLINGDLDGGPGTEPEDVIKQAGAIAAAEYVVQNGLAVPLRSSIYRNILGVTEGAAIAVVLGDLYARLGVGLYEEYQAFSSGACR